MNRLVAVAALAAALVLPTSASAGLVTFQVDDGNIACAMHQKYGVRCDIAERDWEPPPAPGPCELDYGQGLEVGKRGAGRYVCAGDTVLGLGEKVKKGTVVEKGRYTCRVRSEGVKCVNRRTGHGFTISRERKRLF